jgi:Ca2+-transporting ATPase
MNQQFGLDSIEAARRLAAEGPNQLPAADHRGPWRILRDVLREPMFALLLAAGLLYALLGDLAEAAVLLVFASLSTLIAVVQEGRSERVLEALRDLSSPRALVVRDGQRVRISGLEVVRGDLLVLVEGDRVPADGVLVEGEDVQIDESLLTGESVPVSKVPVDALPTQAAVPGGDLLPFVYSGSLVVRGTGLAVATATGVRTQIGQIGHSLGAIDTRPPRLHAQTRRLVLIFAVVGLGLSAGFMLLYGLLRGNWLEAVLSGIALSMSLLPEEFPLVLTVFMVMAAWRLSVSGVLSRRASAIETLGAATVLCTDKTGTLTRNVMSICRLVAPDLDGDPEDQHPHWQSGASAGRIAGNAGWSRLLSMARLASEPEPTDPMERALERLRHEAEVPGPDAQQCLRKYPLTHDRLAVTYAWRHSAHGTAVLAAKGAPEAIARMCRLEPGQFAKLGQIVDRMALEGIRVLGVACAHADAEALPESLDDVRFSFLGLVGFRDPLRDSVPDAVRACRDAGIRVLMITGDYPATARAIARQAGLVDGGTLTGADLDGLTDAQLVERLETTDVFARITPPQKLRIVEALRARGEVVAMTGDGVNDAPALKAADIGIAMGGRGTDVAREASAIVLLNDDFGSIVHAVRHGRRTYDNLRKAMGYVLAIHVPIAGLAIFPVLVGFPLLLTPILIAFLELIIDPACSIAFEAEPGERDLMQRPPRDPQARLLSAGFIGSRLLQGALALALACGVFLWGQAQAFSEEQMRTLVLLCLVGINIALIFANRARGAALGAAFSAGNPWLWFGLTIALLLLVLLLGLPVARRFGGLEAPGSGTLGMALVLAVALFLLVQGFKLMSTDRGS